MCIRDRFLFTAFVLTISASHGRLQFSWQSRSLLAQPDLEEGAYDLSAIKILNRVLLQMQENYVDPERFEPRRMLASGLNAVQKKVAEVVVIFDKPIDEAPSTLTLRVGDASKDFHLKDIENLWEMSLKLKEIFGFIQTHASEDVDLPDIEYTAINGMLRTLDPHSILLSPEYYQDMVEGNRGNFGGLGIVIRVVEGRLLVVRPMPDTPAWDAGIKAGDHIVRIGDESTLNMQTEDAVKLMRGEPGTAIEIWVNREGWVDPKSFELTRDTIKIPSVEHASLGAHMGAIHPKGFQGNT